MTAIASLSALVGMPYEAPYSGSKAAASPVDASVTMAIKGSMPSAVAKASYQAAYHCGCWNGVGGLM